MNSKAQLSRSVTDDAENCMQIRHFLETPIKDLVQGSDKKDLFENAVKKGSAHALRCGLIRVGLPDHLARGLSDQYIAAYELVKGSPNLTRTKLSIILSEKLIGIMRMGNTDNRIGCAISVAVVSVGIVKSTGAILAAAETGGALSGLVVVSAAELVSDLYGMDKECRFSEKISHEIEQNSQAAYMWLDNGIQEFIRRGGR